MADKKCPRCGLWSTGSALRCDCGYDFEKGTIEESYEKKKFLQQMKAVGVFFIIAGIAVLLMLQFGSHQLSVTLNEIEIFTIDNPIWGIGFVVLGIGLVAAGSRR